jgi:uncharacterized RDD family membrane protein YckC
MNCPDCDYAITSGRNACLNCGWIGSQSFHSQQQGRTWAGAESLSGNYGSYSHTGDLASRGIRLGASVLDWALAGLTLGIGWFIWFVIVARRGQSPAKQILRLRVVSDRGGVPSRSVVLLRYFLPNAINWLIAPFGILGFLSMPYAFVLIYGILQVLAWIIPLVDALFIFTPRMKRGVDHMFRTKVVRA